MLSQGTRFPPLKISVQHWFVSFCEIALLAKLCFQDQFDTIDLSENDIRKLDGFPLLKRLKTIILHNNRIVVERVSSPF